MKDLQKFIDLDYKEQLEVLHQSLEDGWTTGKTKFLLSGVPKMIKVKFLRDLIDTYQGSLVDKDAKHFNGLFYHYKRKGVNDEIVYENLINTLMKVVFLNQWNKVSSEKKEDNEKGNYEYIPFKRGRFLALLNMVMTKIPEEIDFLDIGSGIGDKTMLASLHPKIYSSWGIELNQHTYELSKFFLNRFHRVLFNPSSSIDFLNIDGLEFERKSVNTKRRILFYSYVPIFNHKKLMKLYERFLTQMNVGDYYWEIASDIRNVDKRKFKFIVPNRTPHALVWEKIDKNTFKEILCG